MFNSTQILLNTPNPLVATLYTKSVSEYTFRCSNSFWCLIGEPTKYVMGKTDGSFSYSVAAISVYPRGNIHINNSCDRYWPQFSLPNIEFFGVPSTLTMKNTSHNSTLGLLPNFHVCDLNNVVRWALWPKHIPVKHLNRHSTRSAALSTTFSSRKAHCCFLTPASDRFVYSRVNGSWQLSLRPTKTTSRRLIWPGMLNTTCSCFCPDSKQRVQVEVLSSRMTSFNDSVNWRASGVCALISISHFLWCSALMMATPVSLVVVTSGEVMVAVEVGSGCKNR